MSFHSVTVVVGTVELLWAVAYVQSIESLVHDLYICICM